MPFRSTNQIKTQGLTSSASVRSPISAKEKQFLLTIPVDARASSRSPSTRSQTSAMSYYATPSLCESSIDSSGASLMSVDGVQPQYNTKRSMDLSWVDSDTCGNTKETDPSGLKYEDLGLVDFDLLNAASTPSVIGPDPKQPTYFCTYCPDKISFQRSSDWKDHETRKHQAARKFLCAHSQDESAPCREAHLSKAGCDNHHKKDHESQGCHNKCAGIREIPVTIFACGCQGCFALFTDDPEHGRDAWSARCKHVANHFEHGMTLHQWDYSHMIYTLLHQPRLHGMWDELALNRAIEARFDQTPVYLWSAKDTHEIRRLLETAFCGPFDETEAYQFMGRVYELATLQFPGPRFISNTDARVTLSGNTQHNDNSTSSASVPLDAAAAATYPTTAYSDAVIGNDTIAQPGLLCSNRTPSTEDFTTEGTLRAGGRSRARSDASNRPTSTRSRSKSLKRMVSRALSSNSDNDAKAVPPMPEVPSKFKPASITVANAPDGFTGLSYTQGQHGGYAQQAWIDDQLLYGNHTYTNDYTMPINNGVNMPPYYG